MRAVIYARVSRAPDQSADTSTPRQIVNCREFLETRDWYEHAVHRDVDRSAFRPGVVREGFEHLLRDVTSGEVDVVVVWKLDRLTRRAGDFERFWSACEQHSVHLASVTEPVDTTAAIGLAIVRLLMTFAGIESTVRGERIAARYREQAREGKRMPGGRRPFGHADDLTTTVEAEAAVLREAARRVIDGELLTAIARDFRERGIVGGHGVPLSRPGLKSTLISARMVGDRSYHGETVAADCFAPILDRRTHQLVRSLLVSTPKRTRSMRSLLQGLMVCGNCGQHLVSSTSSRGRKLYRCPSPPQGCARVSVTAHLAEDVVVPIARQQLRTGLPVPEPHIDPCHEPKLKELNKAYFVDRAISRSEWYSTRHRLLDDAPARSAWWRLHPDIPPGMKPGDLDRRWGTLSRSAQRAVLAGIIYRIVVEPRPGRGDGFDPTRLRTYLHYATDDEAIVMPSRYPKLNDGDWLRARYRAEGGTVAGIAAEVGCPRNAVRRALQEHQVELRPHPSRAAPPEEWLRIMYIERGYSVGAIAAEAKVRPTDIHHALVEAGIPLRHGRPDADTATG